MKNIKDKKIFTIIFKINNKYCIKQNSVTIIQTNINIMFNIGSNQ